MVYPIMVYPITSRPETTLPRSNSKQITKYFRNPIMNGRINVSMTAGENKNKNESTFQKLK